MLDAAFIIAANTLMPNAAYTAPITFHGRRIRDLKLILYSRGVAIFKQIWWAFIDEPNMTCTSQFNATYRAAD
jgi:hypothetical protein